MPNWANGSVEITARNKKDLLGFARLFIYAGQQGKKKGTYFARSFCIDSWKDIQKDIQEGKDEYSLGLIVDFAWSCHSCIIDGYPNDMKTPTLPEMCKKYKVNVEIQTEEYGLGFEEEVSCNEKGELIEETYIPATYKCKKCGNEQYTSDCCAECDSEDLKVIEERKLEVNE